MNGVTAFEDLTLNLQYRVTDYDSFGSDDAYRIGLNWQITEWIRLRGNVSTAYRAPSVTDLFSGGVQSFDFVGDPCDATTSGITPPTNEWQNCVLDGIADPSTFVQIAQQYPVTAGGNPLLGPETADTVTYGFVLTPLGFLEGLQVAVDWWDIEVQNLITRISSDSQFNDCFSGPVGLTAPTCSQWQGRNPLTGVPIDFRNATVNSDKVETNGLDFSVNYAFEAGNTSWNVALNGTYVDENTFEPFAGGADSRGSIPDLMVNLRTDLFLNDWTFSWMVRYIGDMNDPDWDGNNVFGYSGPGSYDKHDLRVAYDWERYRFVLGINNVTDEDPPYVFDSGTNTDSFLYDSFGTFWHARVTFSL